MTEEGPEKGSRFGWLWKPLSTVTKTVVETFTLTKQLKEEVKTLQALVEKQGDQLDDCRLQISRLGGVIETMRQMQTPEQIERLTKLYVREQIEEELDRRQRRLLPPDSK